MTELKFRLLIVVVPLFMNACALMPNDGPRAKRLAMPSLEQTLASGSSSERTVANWPRADWWREFQNPELDRLIQQALQGNPTLRAARARWNQAEAVADYRAAEMLPSVGASADFHRRKFSATDFYGPNGGKTFTGAYLDPVMFRYHLDLWGKDRAALDAALGQEQAEASELAVARLLLSAEIAKAYFRLVSTEEDAEWNRALVENAEAVLHLAQVRWERGLEVADPVHRALQRLETARQRETACRTEVLVLRNRLAALAGEGPDWGQALRPTASQAAERLPLPKALSLGLLAHRPDVAAALWRVEAAAQTVKVAKTNFYPDVNLVGFAGLRSLNLKDLFLSHGASVAYSIGPTVTLPIFEGGRLDAELKKEQAAYDAAVEAYNGALLGAVQQVADALARWRESVAHDALQEEAIGAAEAAAELAAKRYSAGLSTRDGELEAATGLIEQRLKASSLRSARMQSAVELMAALGGGYESQDTTHGFEISSTASMTHR